MLGTPAAPTTGAEVSPPSRPTRRQAARRFSSAAGRMPMYSAPACQTRGH